MSGFTRRSFFKIVATSGAAVAAGGCGNDVNELVGNIPEKLIPYVVPPDNIVPGVAAYFSTVCRECPAGCGLVAKNRDGRVIKLEGNPDHPVNAGALCIRGQAALQGLYHPDRYRGALMAGKPVAWDEAEKGLADKLQGLVKAKQGSKIAMVTGLETGFAPPIVRRSAATVSPTTPSRTRTTCSPSAPISSRRGGATSPTRAPSRRCTPWDAGRRAPSWRWSRASP